MNPKCGADMFQCPHCKVASQQTWFDVRRSAESVNVILRSVFYDYRSHIQEYQQRAISEFLPRVEAANERQLPKVVPDGFSIATCSLCNEITIWVDGELVYPKAIPVAPPNADMEQEIQDLYIEASAIVFESPKGATALLRLALQLLLKQLGKPGKNINADIKELVASGLSVKIQQALDLLRVVGNNAVHPGQIDLNDGRDIALKLFHVLNFIANEMITKPKELENLYADVVPHGTRKSIRDRDGTTEQPDSGT